MVLRRRHAFGSWRLTTLHIGVERQLYLRSGFDRSGFVDLRVRTFFLVGVGWAVAFGLYVPNYLDVHELAASAVGALAVALFAGGGLGLVLVALIDRLFWRMRHP